MIPGGLPPSMTTAEPRLLNKILNSSNSSSASATFKQKSKRVASAPFVLGGGARGREAQRPASGAFNAFRRRSDSRIRSKKGSDTPPSFEDFGLSLLLNLPIDEFTLDLSTLHNAFKMALGLFGNLSPEVQKIVLWTLLILSILIVPGFWYAKFFAATVLLLFRPVSNDKALMDAMEREAIRKDLRQKQRDASGKPFSNNLHIASLQRIPDVITLSNVPVKSKRTVSVAQKENLAPQSHFPKELSIPAVASPLEREVATGQASMPAPPSMPRLRRPLPTPPSSVDAMPPPSHLSQMSHSPSLPSVVKPQARRMTSSPTSSAILQECSKSFNTNQGSTLPAHRMPTSIYTTTQSHYDTYHQVVSGDSPKWQKGSSGSYRRVSNMANFVKRTFSGTVEEGEN